jgi:hypothetical protein
MFMEDSIRSIEAGVAILPLLRRKLESEEEKPQSSQRGNLNYTIFGGILMLIGVYEYGQLKIIGTSILIIGFLISVYGILKRA